MNVTQKLAEIEREVIIHRYKYYGNNKTKTAESLGIAIRTLDYKLAEYRGTTTDSNQQGGKGFEFKGVERASADGDDSHCRVAVEPPTKDSEKQAVSMRKASKVQRMLPAETP